MVLSILGHASLPASGNGTIFFSFGIKNFHLCELLFQTHMLCMEAAIYITYITEPRLFMCFEISLEWASKTYINACE